MFFRRAKLVPRSQELVFLDADDDLGTIRSKLESSSAEEIYVVIPRRSSVLRTPLEFRILARIANEMSSETVLVTEDPSRRRLAHQEGFRTRRGLRTLKHLMLAPDQRPPRFVLPDWIPLPSFASLLSVVGLAAVAALAVLVVYPVMRVTLVPQTNPISRAVDITIDPDAKVADASTATLPGQTLTTSVDISGSVPIPSDRTIGRDKAHGEVVITSRRPQASTLAKGSTVRVDGGPKFVTDQDRPLPPRVPTEEDRKTLEGMLRKQARDKAFSSLQQRAGSEQTLPEPSLIVDPKVDLKFDQDVGAESDQLTGRMTASVSATVFQNRAYNDLVNQVLERGAGTDSKLGAPAQLDVPGVVKVDGKKVVLRCQATGVLESAIDTKGLGEALRGSTPADARAYLARLSGLAEPPAVDMTPSWAPRAFRIDVVVRGPK